MHANDRPIDNRAPLTHILRSAGGGRRSRSGGECRRRTRMGIQRALLRRGVPNRILQGMAGSRLHALMRPRTRRHERGNHQRCN